MDSRVLIVDDDEFSLHALVAVLSHGDYTVVSATGGAEALDLARQEPFDVVLTDLKMPDMDGLALLRQIKEISPYTAVILLTAYASLDSGIEALRQGAYDYLVKPCPTYELRMKVEKGLEAARLAKRYQEVREELRAERAKVRELLGQTHSAGEVGTTPQKRRAAEAELRWYRELFDLAPEPYLVTDLLGVVQEANQAALELLGTPDDTVRGRPLLDWVPAEDRRRLGDALANVGEDSGTLRFSLPLCRSGGDAVAVEVSLGRALDPHGRPTGWRWILRAPANGLHP